MGKELDEDFIRFKGNLKDGYIKIKLMKEIITRRGVYNIELYQNHSDVYYYVLKNINGEVIDYGCESLSGDFIDVVVEIIKWYENIDSIKINHFEAWDGDLTKLK